MRETKEDRVCGRGRNNGEQIKGGTRGDGALSGRARGDWRREAADAEWMRPASWVYGGGRLPAKRECRRMLWEGETERKNQNWVAGE